VEKWFAELVLHRASKFSLYLKNQFVYAKYVMKTLRKGNSRMLPSGIPEKVRL
jgi:hypothetical protein